MLTVIGVVGLLSCQQASAGDNSCAGVISVGKEWTTMFDKDLPDNTCRFKTDSDMGRKILAACPHHSVSLECRCSKTKAVLTVTPNAHRSPARCPELDKLGLDFLLAETCLQ
jgi:hypothetical protein